MTDSGVGGDALCGPVASALLVLDVIISLQFFYELVLEMDDVHVVE